MLRLLKALPLVLLACTPLFLVGCGDDTPDEMVYAAEFFPDEDGRVREGEPQYLLTAVIEKKGDGYQMYYAAPQGEEAGYAPGDSDKIMIGESTNGADKKRPYMLSLSDHSIAHLNPYRTYSPFIKKKGDAYQATKRGAKYDVKAKRYYRVTPKELPCWRCGGTGTYTLFGETYICEEADENGFQEYYGRQEFGVEEGKSLTAVSIQKEVKK